MRTNIVEDNFVSHHDEPQVGDAIVNNNPDCKHYESEAIVVKIESLPEDKGKTATYKCTNSGDNWIEGDVLTKTMDQLIPLGDVERVVAELMNGLSSPSMDVEGQIKDLIEEMLQEESRAADELLSPHNAHILNETYITQVLGLQIPLTESYPYTPNFRSQVLHEQLIFEGFWADLKNLKGNTAAIMGAVGVIVKDGSKIGDFIKRIKKGAIDEPFNAIKDFLTNLYEVLKEWAMPTFAKIAEMAKGMLDQVVKIAKKVFSMSGWKQALSIIGFAMAIKFIWDNIGDIVDEGNKKLKAASAMMGALVGGKLKDAMTHAGKLGESDTQTLEKPLLLEDERLDEWGFLNYLFGGEEEEIEEEEISDFDVDGDGEVTPEEVEAHEKEPEQKEKRQERNKNAPAPKIGIALKQGDQITKDGVFLSLDQAKEAGIEGKTPDEIKAAKIDSAKQKAEKIQKKLEDEGHAGEEGAAPAEAHE